MCKDDFGDPFQGAEYFANQPKPSRIDEFVKNNTKNVCFDAGLHFGGGI